MIQSENIDDEDGSHEVPEGTEEEEEPDLTLNSLSQPNDIQEQDEDVSSSQINDNSEKSKARGSNFASNNAFDESLRESPIKKRYDIEQTLVMERN